MRVGPPLLERPEVRVHADDVAVAARDADAADAAGAAVDFVGVDLAGGDTQRGHPGRGVDCTTLARAAIAACVAGVAPLPLPPAPAANTEKLSAWPPSALLD